MAQRQQLADTIDIDMSMLTPATLARVEEYVYSLVKKNTLKRRRRNSVAGLKQDQDLDSDSEGELMTMSGTTPIRIRRSNPAKDTCSSRGKMVGTSLNVQKARKTSKTASPRNEQQREHFAKGKERRDSFTALSGEETAPALLPLPTETSGQTNLGEAAYSGSTVDLASEYHLGQPQAANDQSTSPSSTGTSMNHTGGVIRSKGVGINRKTGKKNSAKKKSASSVLLLPPKKPQQASPTSRPRRTRKMRLYDPYQDKVPLSQPLQVCTNCICFTTSLLSSSSESA